MTSSGRRSFGTPLLLCLAFGLSLSCQGVDAPDGLWEARNPQGEMFGKEPIHQIIRQSPAASAKEILTACFNRFNVFLNDRAPEDDVTLVVIRITKDSS